MRTTCRALIASWLIALPAFALPAPAAAGTEATAYIPAKPIPAPDGRWDFASWDAAHHRLIVAHGKDVLLIDPSHPEAFRTIGQIEGAHGAVAIPGSDRVLVSSGRDNSVRILDGSTGAEIARITVAADPDAMILSPDGHHAYVMDAKAGAVSVIDLDRMTESSRIMLKPGLEVPVIAGRNLLAVNNEDASEIDLADLRTGKAAGTIPLKGCEGPTGMAYDDKSGLAISACANGKAALVDLAHRRLVRLLPIGQGPDTAIWQADHHRFLIPCGRSGTLSIIELDNRGGTHVLPPVTSETSARTAALDPDSGRLYLPAAQFQPAPVGGRPAIVAGSFHIVVLTPGA